MQYTWLTCDTGRALRIGEAGYLLRPGGAAPLYTPFYAGNGCFGGIDAHEWFAIENLPMSLQEGMTADDLAIAGMMLDIGVFYQCLLGGGRWIEQKAPLRLDVEEFQEGPDQALAAYGGKTPAELVREGAWEALPLKTLLPVQYPIKIAQNPAATYERMPAPQFVEMT